MRFLIIISLLVFGTLSTNAKKPQDKGKSKQKQEAVVSVTLGDEHLSITASLFSTSENRVLTSYRSTSQHKQKKLPKGLQKKLARGGALPPGWQKKLSRGAVIDREVYRQARPLPEEIIIQLPPAPRGTIIVEIDGEIVRLAEATLTIVDILSHH